jgi:hypothetical protein
MHAGSAGWGIRSKPLQALQSGSEVKIRTGHALHARAQVAPVAGMAFNNLACTRF